MKKIFVTGLLALCLVAVSQQQASAWHNSRFGIGLNWDCSSGGNSFGWGLWRSGQPPGPEVFNGYGYGHGHGHHHQGMPYAMQGAPSFEPAFAQPVNPYAPMYPTPYQFATYPRPIYYYYDR